jgi:GWxTD domain-containing protein
MKNKTITGLFIFFQFFPLFLYAQKQPDLPEKYEKWIKEEVVYIITQNEREVFHKLVSDKERDMFINEFWHQRDPTPGTLRNELKEEHYRRIDYSNKKFKRYSKLKGWQTDRGQIYIILGEPVIAEPFHHTAEAYPIEIWTYYGDPSLRQAPIFRLLFVRKFGVGPFELYNPIADGPKSLTPMSSMRLFSGKVDVRDLQGERPGGRDPGRGRGIPPDWVDKVKDPRDLAAYEILRDNVSFELAAASFSSFPGREGPDFMLPSAILIGDVKTYPQKKVQDDYAYEFLEHKAIVEVDYSVNYIGGKYCIHILEDKTGLFFVNYSIEPDVLSVDFYQNKYFTNIRMTARVTGPQEETIFQLERNFPFEMKKDQLKKIKERPFQLFDSFPLIPGSYKLSLLFENMVTKEFTTIERDIIVPEPDSLQMSSLILMSRVLKNSPHKQVNKAFQVGKLQIYPSLKNRFFKEDTMFIFFQLLGLTEELEEQGKLKYAFFKGDQKFKIITKKIKECVDKKNFLEAISLKGIPSGLYDVEVSLLDGKEREVLFDKKEFRVSAARPPLSWIVSQSNPPSDDPVYSYILGNQYINKGEIGKARDILEKACFLNPDSLDFALSYTKALMFQKKHQRIKEILRPFAQVKKEDFSLYYYLGKSSQEMDELEEAISYYQNALSLKGDIAEVLNEIGECYFRLGEKGQALKAWEKSLEVNPDQEKIRKLIENYKKKEENSLQK